MKLTHPWNNKAYNLVTTMLESAGFQAYAVGGCVRDAVLGTDPNDIDIATDARPHDLPKIFGVNQWVGDDEVRRSETGAALYPTGVAHGTWTLRFEGDEVEITTFRKDVATDGRRATVTFADTIEEDALRRDFTMNALYYKNGEVFDPTGQGLADLSAGIVRFVGVAEERIREDYLRILRLFRFHAKYGKGELDTDAFDAVRNNVDELVFKVSGERVWSEVKKILSMENPASAVVAMEKTGTLMAVAPNNAISNRQCVTNLVRSELILGVLPRWENRYVTLFASNFIPYPTSKKEAAMVGNALRAYVLPFGMDHAIVAYKFGTEGAKSYALFNNEELDFARAFVGISAVYPIDTEEIMVKFGIAPGKLLGRILKDSKDSWVNSGFKHSRERLLSDIKALLEQGIYE